MTGSTDCGSSGNMTGEVRNLDAKKVSAEILGWLTANVENFIDNHERDFWIYLTVNAESSMPESKRMQDLFMSENADNEEMGNELHALSSRIHEEMMADKEGLQALFKRMIFFYEMTGFSREKGPIIQEMDGNVTIHEFGFDPVPMEMTVKQPIMMVQNGEVKDTGEKRIVKTEKIPPAFMIELEINFWPRQPSTSMY